VKFADLWAESRDQTARAEYESLLTDLETTFAQRSQMLIEGGRSDLDIEISVLRDRLKFETPSGGSTPPQV
jgi:tRNA threonylcarbamoyladenosine modification (KEOPS) complex  Pcc1 subunit